MSNRQQAPLSRTQMGIYVESTQHPESTMYNIPFLGKLGKSMDPGRLKAALHKVILAHPCLETVLYPEKDGTIMQRICQGAVRVEEYHLSDEEFALKRNSLVRPFDLQKGPLCRFELYHTPSAVYLFEDYHHIIMDGVSFYILADDLADAYKGKEIREETYTGLDAAADDAAAHEAEAYQLDRNFYGNLLENVDPDCLPAPDRFGEKPEQGHLSHRFVVDPEKFARFRKVHGISTTAFFTGVAGFLTAKFNYRDDSLICTVYSGRKTEQTKRTVSMLVKTLPFVTNLGGNPTIPELLKRGSDTLMAERQHDRYSFEEMAADYGIRSDINFAFQGKLLDYTLMPGADMEVERVYDGNHIEHTPLLLELSEIGGGVYELFLSYRADMFSPAFAESLARSFGIAAGEFLKKDRVDDVELTDEDGLAALECFNATEQSYDTRSTIVDLFRRQAADHPDRTAVVYQDRSYTYREIDDRSDRLAGELLRRGIQKEDVVGILVPRSEYMVICSLGVLKAGAGYMPMDPSYPTDRLNFMLKDAGAFAVITAEWLEERIEDDIPVQQMRAERIAELPAADEKLPSMDPEDLFIVLYTSGSTGLPKGVMLEHRNLMAFCSWARRYYGMDEHTKCSAYASFGFDACMFDLWPALTAGGTVHIIDESIRLNLLELQDYYNRNGITHSFITTQVGRQFAQLDGTRTLQHLSVGGEKLVPLDPPAYQMDNVYGPTECTVLVTTQKVTERFRDVPIGPPIDNIRLYITDKNGKRLPQGAAGELLIAGPQVGRSYLNRPEQTAAAFTANPFCSEKEYERLYHTGDVVRFLENGSVQFIGRRDAQVKIRGFRIELTEVEEVIRRFPGIRDATVAAWDDPAGGKYLAAYVVSDEKVSVEDLNAFIRQEKPSYMVPAVTMQIDRIPMNQNQKVNKRALPKPERRFENVREPQNENQKKIYQIVSEVIGGGGFGINTDLYEAGLTSVGSVRLNVLLSKAFGKAVQMRDLSENNTVEKLEQFLVSKALEPAGEEGEEKREDYPLSSNQEGIFVETMAHPDSTVYNIPLLLEIAPEVDTKRLAEAAAAAVAAHPYIKTRLFMNDAGEVRQKRMDGEPFTAEDVEELVIPRFDPEKTKLAKPFSLLNGRLFRICIIHSERNYLFVEMHHIISDGTSMNLFLEDISRAYAGEKPEPEKFTGFDAAVFEKRERDGKAFEKAKDYNRELLHGGEMDCLPEGDGEKTGTETKEADRLGRYALAVDVRQYCEAGHLSLNSFFTAAFGLVLSKYTGKEESVFVSIYNGRSDSRLAGSVAMLVKTFPVRLHFSRKEKDVPVKKYVSETAEQLLESMTNDICSFGEISRGYGIRADVMFAYQGEGFSFDRLCGYPSRLVRLPADQAKAPLNMTVEFLQERIHYCLEYNGARFSSTYAEGFLDAMDMAVSELLTKRTIGEVSVLSPEARREMQTFNDTEGPVSTLTVPEMLERQALLHPDKIAVTAGEESLTFGELDGRSNRIANALLQKGIAAEDRVAFYMKRTVDAYAVREGILKAGGAFLGLDPEYPDERISYILQDAGARFLIVPADLFQVRRTLADCFAGEILTLEDLYGSYGDDETPAVTIPPENLAYCIYTSGSTGKPKGVMIEHRNLMNMLSLHGKNILAKDYVENTTVFLGLAAFTFDVSVIEEFMPLCHGQTVALATEDEIHNPALLASMMIRRGVDMMKCTPSYMSTMLDYPESSRVLSRLQAVIIGAEPFPAGLYDRMRRAGLEGKIFNSYGPTETTVTVTIDELDGRQVTIGRPAGNTGVYMLDAFGNILPKFARGELVITGKSVGRGYIGLEKQTTEKFISLLEENAYRSGDIAWWNAEGKIVLCGRRDNQVKLRGLRVELDEIAAVMNRFAGIRQSIVLVKGEGAQQFLCGYYVSEEPVPSEELKQFLGRSLAEYMIPTVFVHLSVLPMTPNGKIDKKALPDPVPEAKARTGREPKTDLERKFCELFGSILGLSHVYADDDFFELGGTSLSASRVAMKCMAEHIPVVYSDVFRFGTAEKLAAYAEGRSEAGSGEAARGKVTVLPSDSAGREEEEEKGELRKDILRYNCTNYLDRIQKGRIGNVLVTGATGFLGIHVVKELLEAGEMTGTEKIYCLVRRGRSRTAESRMKAMLMYYFDDPYEKEFGSRLIPVEGDITDEGLADRLQDCDYDTVINCAASVKHFAADDLLERVNVKGVRNLIQICMKSGKKLIQISTVSVAGESVDNHVPEEVRLKEDMLEFGQKLDNAYARSKYEAEEVVLQAVSEGLSGKIIRVGNLMSRAEDGEFQINYSTNAFMNRLRAYSILQEFPVGSLDQEVEFSPIDSTAKAIIYLAGTDDCFTVFHAYNCHSVHMANVLDVMNEYGIPVKAVPDEAFQSHFQAVLRDETKNAGLSGLIAYRSSGMENRRYIGWDNRFTVKALYRLGFSWPLTGEEYIRRAVDALSTLGFFDYE